MGILIVAGCLLLTNLAYAQTKNTKSDGEKEREYFVQILLQITHSVLQA